MDGCGLGSCVAMGFAGIQTIGFRGAFVRRASSAEGKHHDLSQHTV
jgi:hypothetical protein